MLHANAVHAVRRVARTLKDLGCRLSERHELLRAHTAPIVIKESFSSARRVFVFLR
jgi:hypothetical protein